MKRLKGTTSKPRRRIAIVLTFVLAGCSGCLGKGGMNHEQASTKLMMLVDSGLDAGLNGRDRPQPDPLGYDACTDDLLGPTGEARPAYSYLFQYSVLGDDGQAFADKVAGLWQNEGLRITATKNDPNLIERFAVSDDGFHLSLAVNREIDQVYIGGSGPCVDPPEGAL